jgi:hypothetical protein
MYCLHMPHTLTVGETLPTLKPFFYSCKFGTEILVGLGFYCELSA